MLTPNRGCRARNRDLEPLRIDAGPQCLRRSLDGKADAEHGASSHMIGAADFAAMFLNDSIAGAQAQAYSVAYWLGGVERIEDVRGILYSRTGVGNFHVN